MYEILWLSHGRIVWYFTIEFQREPTFMRFTDTAGVCQGGVENADQIDLTDTGTCGYSL